MQWRWQQWHQAQGWWPLSCHRGSRYGRPVAGGTAEPGRIEEETYKSYKILRSGSGGSTQIARFMWPTWGPPGTCRPQVGPMNLAIRVDMEDQRLKGLQSLGEWKQEEIDGLVQERWNSGALAMELHLSCIKPSKYLISGLLKYLDLMAIGIIIIWRRLIWSQQHLAHTKSLFWSDWYDRKYK